VCPWRSRTRCAGTKPNSESARAVPLDRRCHRHPSCASDQLDHQVTRARRYLHGGHHARLTGSPAPSSRSASPRLWPYVERTRDAAICGYGGRRRPRASRGWLPWKRWPNSARPRSSAATRIPMVWTMTGSVCRPGRSLGQPCSRSANVSVTETRAWRLHARHGIRTDETSGGASGAVDRSRHDSGRRLGW